MASLPSMSSFQESHSPAGPSSSPPPPPPPPPSKPTINKPTPTSTSSPAPPSKPPRPAPPRQVPIAQSRRLLILCLRYAVSPKEYDFLRRRVVSARTLLPGSSAVARHAPTSHEFEAVVAACGRDDFVPAATRAGLRLLLLCNVALNSWDALTAALAKRRGKQTTTTTTPTTPTTAAAAVSRAGGGIRRLLFNRANFLSSLSVAALVVLHRLLYRFFFQLRANLLLPQAKTFRVRHRKVSKLFLSPVSPAIGASLAGLALGIHPATERRVTVAVFALAKALEYAYNRLEDTGRFRNRPWWFGSWLLFPLTSGQLLYAFVFDRDCFPSEYASAIVKYSQEYIQTRPADYPAQLPYPDATEIVDSIGAIASSYYPPFNSPILFPNAATLPANLAAIAPVIEPAHPAIKSLQCALLHPSEPSCTKTYLSFWASTFPRIARLLALVYMAAWIPRYRALAAHPITSLAKMLRATLLTTTFLTGTLGTAWGAACLFQHVLPRAVAPQGRFWLAGLLGGVWAFVDRTGGRANFIYSLRIGLVSAWKVLVKRGVVRPWRAGDVLLFVSSLAVVNAVFDMDAQAVTGAVDRRALWSLRGRGWTDVLREKKEGLVRERRGERGEREREREREREGAARGRGKGVGAML